jgi:hypothetical protein
MKLGEVTITLTKAGDESYYAINKTYHIQVLGASALLAPDKAPVLEYNEYAEITFNRTFVVGHSTLALPFDTNISDFSDDSKAYAAQLSLVTYNKADGYTLYFKKVADGQMLANQPYVVYLPEAINNPEWADVIIMKPEVQSIVKNGWTMRANYTPEMSMVGNYGIAGGKLCLGTTGSTINAYTAYFIPPAANARVRMAVLDDDGGVTYIDDVREDAEGAGEAEQIYRLDGTKHATLTKGINIVKMANGEVRKVLK